MSVASRIYVNEFLRGRIFFTENYGGKNMIEQLHIAKQLQFVSKIATQKQVVCVEAGHIYTDETPSLTHEIGAMVGSEYCKALERIGIQVQKMLFIDDFNAKSQDLDIDSYTGILAKHGFMPDSIIMESSLFESAQDVISQLEAREMIDVNRHGAIILKKYDKKEKDIVLQKSPNMGGAPACAALDTALYLKKYEDSGICLTVLPTEWKGQQNGVKKVLKALGKKVPIIEVYYTDEGDIEVEDFDY